MFDVNQEFEAWFQKTFLKTGANTCTSTIHLKEYAKPIWQAGYDIAVQNKEPTLPQKNSTPFKKDDRVFVNGYGFGDLFTKTSLIGCHSVCVIQFDALHELENIKPEHVFHATDPCIQIFGVKNE